MTKKLSFCAVVKDSLVNVRRMVESIDKVADEKIIIDTGSEKKVIDFEKSVADKFYQLPWENNFAKVRNFAIDKAQGEWIFTLDSDETASNKLIGKIPQLIAEEKVDGYKLPRIHYAGEARPMKDYWRHLRLYKRSARYVGAVHESIKNLENIKIIDDFTFCIYHYNNRAKQREKSLKYSKYLQQKIQQVQACGDKHSEEYYQYKLWVQDNIYLLETDPKVDENLLAKRYQEYEIKKKEIEEKIKKEGWEIK